MVVINTTTTTNNNNRMRLNPTTPMEYTIFDPAVTVEFVEFVGPEVEKKNKKKIIHAYGAGKHDIQSD